MEKDYPYMTEYAKSSRSCCKLCKISITKDSLRMAKMCQSPHFDGKIPNWYHFDCFFNKFKLNCLGDINNVDTLRWEDQENIKMKLNEAVSEPPYHLTIEYSKAKNKCNGCKEKINKGDIRILIMEKVNNTSRVKKSWYHINCFIDLKNEIIKEATFDIEKINGFDSLSEDDKQILSKFKTSNRSKKRPVKDDSEPFTIIKKPKLEDELDNQLKEQNLLLWDVRDKINAEVSKAALVHLLEINKQHIPIGEANLLNSVADCMVFGCLNACPECGGQLHYSSSRYKCKSMVNEWSKCLYTSREVIRSPFVISEEYMEADILKNYRYKKLTRILPPESEECSNINPLKGYYVTIDQVNFPEEFGKLQIQNRIKELGGRCNKTLTTSSLILISTIEGLKTKKSHKTKAENYGVDVVSAEFLINVKNVDLVEAIKKNSLVNWGRSKDEIATLYNSGERTADKDNWQIQTIKGGAAVDPDSGLIDKAHLYQDRKTRDPLNAILGTADIITGSNSFYKIQLLESDKLSKWWVFRSWGRIGTAIGSNKLELFHDLDSAIKNFCGIYLEKTGNKWENRNEFKKCPYKFVPLDIDYGNRAKVIENITEESSNLPQTVEGLIRFIFDVESMKRAMLEFKIDSNKMPLGKVSQKQIDISYTILKELQDLLINSNPTKTKLCELSNRFYTMMPHNFGMMSPPLINSLSMVKDKCEMIESLMEIEVAYKLMEAEKGKNIIDSQYEKLHNCISPLDKSSDVYKRLETYLQNTHAPTHNYKIMIEDIFDVSREGESNRYHSFKRLPNRMMLWHGSRRTNWAGILSQGLRIAPPEAPVTGYMFGKGVYFADVVSKSANYCHSSSTSPDGILLLCEVALGKMTERYQADSNIVLKPGEHSCKGVGLTEPDPNGNFDDNGVIYPMGKLVQQDIKSSLLYNEYIVYDIGQIKQRYLFKVKFIYK